MGKQVLFIQIPFSILSSEIRVLLFLVWEGHSHMRILRRVQGKLRSENSSCVFCFWHFFSLKYFISQGAIFGVSISWTPVNVKHKTIKVKIKYWLIIGWSQNMGMFLIIKTVEETFMGTRKQYGTWICNSQRKNTTNKKC